MIIKEVPFPLDDDGFFRRECPYCYKEFKVFLKKEELNEMSKINVKIEGFMLENKTETEKNDEWEEIEYTCPYCGQSATQGSWWTQEQLSYIHVITQNIANKLINKHLIEPLKRSFGDSRSGPISIKLEGNKLPQFKEWIRPEKNDMRIFKLPCCDRKIKIEDDWNKAVYCFFCGFRFS